LQPRPFRCGDRAEEPDLPVVFKRSPDVDANDAVLAMGALDLLVLDFDEVRAVQDLW
jgi:hypothetical protein